MVRRQNARLPSPPTRDHSCIYERVDVNVVTSRDGLNVTSHFSYSTMLSPLCQYWHVQLESTCNAVLASEWERASLGKWQAEYATRLGSNCPGPWRPCWIWRQSQSACRRWPSWPGGRRRQSRGCGPHCGYPSCRARRCGCVPATFTWPCLWWQSAWAYPIQGSQRSCWNWACSSRWACASGRQCTRWRVFRSWPHRLGWA